MRTMERIMARLALDNRPQNRDQPEPQIRQQDQRNQRNAEDQHVRPPFSNNYVD